MTKSDYKAILKRFNSNRQTQADEQAVAKFANPGEPDYRHALERFRKHHQKTKETQLDMFFENGLMMPFKNDDSAIPKQILRSSMFAPITRGKRKYLNDKLVAESPEGDITYTGAQLDQADLDVLLAIIKLLSEYTNSGNVVKVAQITDENGRLEYSRLICGSKGLLKMIKRSQGKSGRKWLWSSLQRLTGELTLNIDFGDATGDKYFAGQILGKRAKTEDDLLMIDINHDFVWLFGGNNFSFINMGKRFQLTGDFTKWLQGFVSTHTGETRYSAEKLMIKSGSKQKSVKHWILRQAKPAFEQLKDLELINNFSVEGHLFTWFR